MTVTPEGRCCFLRYHIIHDDTHVYITKNIDIVNKEIHVCVYELIGEMHLKNIQGSFVRVGYRIPVPDFYLVLHGLRCQKSTIMD